MLRRAAHWTDAPVVGKQRRHTIGNWSNYREPGKSWQEACPAVEESADAPDNWAGDFDFQLQSIRSPLQSFLGDTTDPDNAAMAGCRLADDPGIWINLKAVDVSPGGLFTELSGARAVEWPGIWPNTTLKYEASAHKLAKTLILEKPGHPLVFRFTLRTADGMSIKFADSGARILDADGVERMRLLAPWGRDSSTVHPGSLDGHKPIGVTLCEGSPQTIEGQEYQVVELAVNEEDLEGAVYPVVIDPTVQITGTTDIEDAPLYGPNPDLNYGSSSTLYMREVSNPLSSIIRILAGSIPGGPITGFRLICYGTIPGIIKAYFIVDANTWVEGTKDGGVEAGSSCYNYAKYDTQPWVGGNSGCRSYGEDFDADVTPPQVTLVFGSWNSFALKPEWPPLWRDAVRAANGIVLLSDSGNVRSIYSTEQISSSLYFEIDYELGAPPIAAMSMPRMIL